MLGTVFGIPFNDSLAGLAIYISVSDKNEDLITDIGECMIGFSDNSDTHLQDLTSVPLDSNARITRNKGRERVGKIVYSIRKVSIFADGLSGSNYSRKKAVDRDQSDDLNVQCALPNFQFNRLLKPVHWERLKGLNIDRLFASTTLYSSTFCFYPSASSPVYIHSRLFSFVSVTRNLFSSAYITTY